MRSASRLCAAGAACALLGLTGCVTTQRRSARAQLLATRLLASREPLVVTRRNPDIRVERVALVRGTSGTAVVVELANTSARVLSDVPISVGVAARGRRTYLNRRGGLDYFQSRVAAIGPGAAVTWVFTTRRRIPGGARPFALAGLPARRPATGAGLPPVVATATAVSAGSSVRVRVRNPGEVPQYGMPVYALARRGGRYVAAGRGTLAHVGTRGTGAVELKLIGDARQAWLAVEALPTIFE